MTGVETAAVLAPLVTEAASAAIPAAAAATAGTAAGTAAATGAATGAGLAGAAGAEAALTPALFAGADAAGAAGAGLAGDAAATGGLLGSGGFGPATMGANEFGLQGLSSLSGAPGSAQFMTLPASQFSSAAGVGGVGPGLETTIAGAVGDGASSGGLLSTKDALRFANQGQKMMNQKPQQRGRAPMMQGDAGTQPRQMQSFQSLSPYASLQGGFNPRKYGANAGKSGLLG